MIKLFALSHPTTI